VAHVQGLDLTYSFYTTTRSTYALRPEANQASVQLSDRLSKSLTALVKFGYRRVSVGDIVIPALPGPQLLQPVRIGMCRRIFRRTGGTIRLTRHEACITPRTSDWLVVFFGSQRSFMRVLLRNATYYHLTTHLILARQTRFGSDQTILVSFRACRSWTRIPLPERFFGGRADSVARLLLQSGRAA